MHRLGHTHESPRCTTNSLTHSHSHKLSKFEASFPLFIIRVYSFFTFFFSSFLALPFDHFLFPLLTLSKQQMGVGGDRRWVALEDSHTRLGKLRWPLDSFCFFFMTWMDDLCLYLFSKALLDDPRNYFSFGGCHATRGNYLIQ